MSKEVGTAIVAGALALATLAGGARPASATTAPSVIINVRITMTDTTVTLSRNKARRGWGAVFTIVNKGKKAHRLEIGYLPTPVVRPGKRTTVKLFLEYRGPQPIVVTLNRGGPKHSTVFHVT